jgi:hypothetical protein
MALDPPLAVDLLEELVVGQAAGADQDADLLEQQTLAHDVTVGAQLALRAVPGTRYPVPVTSTLDVRDQQDRRHHDGRDDDHSPSVRPSSATSRCEGPSAGLKPLPAGARPCRSGRPRCL